MALVHADRFLGLQPDDAIVVGVRLGLIAALHAGVGNVFDRRNAIAPFGVHLQIAAILLKRGTLEVGVGENPPHLRAAQEVPPKLAAPLDIAPTLALLDGLFDGRRSPGLENLANDARRTRPDARNPRKSAVGLQQISQRRIE